MLPHIEPEPERDGLFGLARKLTNKPKQQKPRAGADGKTWEMSKLLAAVETSESRARDLKPSAAAAMGALEAALADLAVDLDAIAGDTPPGEEDWRAYLAGDRAAFARRLAGAIDSETVDRVAALYREDTPLPRSRQSLHERVRSIARPRPAKATAAACSRRRF